MCVHVDHDYSAGTSDDSAGTSLKKWIVTRKTIEGWISQYNRVSHDAMAGFLMQGDGDHVAKVQYKVCCEFRKQSIFLWNYQPTFFEGKGNIRSLLYSGLFSKNKILNKHSKFKFRRIYFRTL